MTSITNNLNNEDLIAQATSAVKTIESYYKNPIIMEFVVGEAMEKVTKIANEGLSLSMSSDDINSMVTRTPNLQTRIMEYVKLGITTCYIAALREMQDTAA